MEIEKFEVVNREKYVENYTKLRWLFIILLSSNLEKIIIARCGVFFDISLILLIHVQKTSKADLVFNLLNIKNLIFKMPHTIKLANQH